MLEGVQPAGYDYHCLGFGWGIDQGGDPAVGVARPPRPGDADDDFGNDDDDSDGDDDESGDQPAGYDYHYLGLGWGLGQGDEGSQHEDPLAAPIVYKYAIYLLCVVLGIHLMHNL